MIVTDKPVTRATAVCVLTLLLCLTSCASGEYESQRVSDSRIASNHLPKCEGPCDKRAENLSGMWFGPRLGRRRRSDPGQETDSIVALANALEDARLAVIMIPATNEKRQTPIKPRLGRDSSEDQSYSYEDAIDRTESYEDEPPVFSPRLGRYADLGHQLRYIPRPRPGRQSHALRKL